MMSETLSKAQWREQIKSFYRKLSANDFSHKSSKLSKLLFNEMAKVDGVWGLFSPISFEPALKVDQLKSFAYPDFVDNRMIFKLCSANELIASDNFGVTLKTPPLEARLIEPNVILVPGLAFTRDGKRLGRGKGFYDRYLKEFSGLKIGICFSEQIATDLPTEAHDQRVNMLLTDGGLIRCLEF